MPEYGQTQEAQDELRKLAEEFAERAAPTYAKGPPDNAQIMKLRELRERAATAWAELDAAIGDHPRLAPFAPLPVREFDRLPIGQQAPLIAVWNTCIALRQILVEMVPSGPARERALAELAAAYQYAHDGITEYASVPDGA